jgi:hypothetical protein
VKNNEDEMYFTSLRTYPKSRFRRFETTDVDAKRLAEGYTDEHRYFFSSRPRLGFFG